jgi:tRNA-binding protein
MDPLDAFGTLEMRVGRIVAAEIHAAARKPTYILSIDFGPAGLKTSSAQLAARYRPEDLVGRLVVAATNLGVRRIAGVSSEVLVLGVPDETGGVVLLTTERDVPLGGRVF